MYVCVYIYIHNIEVHTWLDDSQTVVTAAVATVPRWYMHVHIYIYIYICIHILSSSRKPSRRFLWFPSSTSSNAFAMVPSLVFWWFPSWQETFSYGFRRWFLFMVSVVAGKHCFMVSVAGSLVDSAAAGGSVFCVFRTGFRRWFFDGFRRGKVVLWFPSLIVLWFTAATGPRLSLRGKP